MEGQSFLLEISSELRKIGFSEKAALIYGALLEKGSAYPSYLAEYTRINRTTVYKILNDLCMKGLVTEIDKNNKLCYQLEKPARLLGFVKRQINLAEERYETAQKIFPELKTIFSSISNKPFVRFFEGEKGMMTIYEDHVENFHGQELVAFMNTNEFQKMLPTRFITKYLQARVEAKVKLRCIAPKPIVEYNPYRYYRKLEKKFWPKYKFVDPKLFPFKSHIAVYGNNRVSIVNAHERTVVGIIIEDQVVNGMMRMIFDLAWGGVKESEDGIQTEPDS